MNKQAQPVFLILFLIVVPFLVYAFIQIKSLDEDERMAHTVYEKQMETVLFSLNQYADDMMGQWMRKLSNDQQPMTKNAADLILGNESIQLLILREIKNQRNHIFFNDYVEKDIDADQLIEAWYKEKDSTLSKLTNYLDAGFQKIQPVEDWVSVNGLQPNQVGVTAMAYGQDSVLYNALLILESNFWVEQVLGSKMQEIDQDDFRLGVFYQNAPEDQPTFFFQTDTFDIQRSAIEKALWILPETYLTIQPKGESYSEIIRSRSTNNLYFLLFAMATVVIGAVLVIRNIRMTLKMAQLKSDFVSNVSHEIRTPLALIRMYAETLMLGRLASDDKKKKYYEVIHHESGRLTYLVNNILDFSRIEANRKTYQLEEKELNSMVENIYSNFSHYFRENNFDCNLELCTDPIPFSVDPQAFEEALSNLIENAIKYTQGRKLIEISTYLKDGFGYCDVKDHGIGISKTAQKNIFDKFYRVESALTQKTKGTGLGLSLVKHIMQSHQGTVTVNSKLGQGSTFSLKFPLIHQ